MRGYSTTTATGPVVCGPGYEYFLLAEQVRRCGQQLDAIIGRAQQTAAVSWQSPAGDAFRRRLLEHRLSLLRRQDELSAAVRAITRLAEAVEAEQLAEQLAERGWAAP